MINLTVTENEFELITDALWEFEQQSHEPLEPELALLRDKLDEQRDLEVQSCQAPHCWSEYGTQCGECPLPISEPESKPVDRPWFTCDICGERHFNDGDDCLTKAARVQAEYDAWRDKYDTSVVNGSGFGQRVGSKASSPPYDDDLIPLDDPEALRAAGLGHLAKDAPYQQCSRCQRKTWDIASFGGGCLMTQPGGFPCGGVFKPLVEPDPLVKPSDPCTCRMRCGDAPEHEGGTCKCLPR